MRLLLVVIACATLLAAPAALGNVPSNRAVAWRVLHAVFRGDTDHDGIPDGTEAFKVVGCETGYTYSAYADDGPYLGFFQQDAHHRATWGFSRDLWASARINRRAWVANRDSAHPSGRCWTCNSQWPTCGRGLD